MYISSFKQLSPSGVRPIWRYKNLISRIGMTSLQDMRILTPAVKIKAVNDCNSSTSFSDKGKWKMISKMFFEIC